MTALDATEPKLASSGSQRWAVIGGGLLGMELARRLRTVGQDVTLFEASPHLGGLADAWTLGSITWDRHYHVILMSDTRLRGLLADLDLEKEIRWVETRTGFYTNGQLYSMSNTLEFLKFPPLRLIDKLRLGATIFYASKIKNGRKLESVPVETWLRRWSGHRTTEKIWLPLLRAKLGENYRQTSAAFLWAIIARMYAARRSGLKKEMFGYVRGGYARIIDRFAERLSDLGITIQTSAPVRSIVPSNQAFQLSVNGEEQSYDRVVVTTAAPLAARMCPTLPKRERELLLAPSYQGIVCASLVLRKPLANYYVTNITEPGIPFTAVIEMTALVDPAEFGGKRLIYLPKYVAPEDPLFDASDEAIRESFVSALEMMYPHFRREDVEAFRVSRVKHVLAISTMNYSEIVPPMNCSIPGLYFVNSAQIVNGTLNVNETLHLADRGWDAAVSVEVPR